MHTQAHTGTHTLTHTCVCTWIHRITFPNTLLPCSAPVHWPGLLHFLPGPTQPHSLSLRPFPHCFLNGWFPTPSWSLLNYHLSSICTPLFQPLFPLLFFHSTYYIFPALLALLILFIVYCLTSMQESKLHKGRNYRFIH